MTFRELRQGQTFDWIGPVSMHNSFYARCIKVSARVYIELDDAGHGVKRHRVGSIHAPVYHVA